MQSDDVVIALAAIAAVGTIVTTLTTAIVAILTARQTPTIERTERLVNGQTERLVSLTAATSRAEGVTAGAMGEVPGQRDA